MRAGLILLAASLFAGTALAQPILMSGQIGKAPVFLDLDRNGDTVSGWYFYLKVGKQLRLEGKLNPSGFFDITEYTASTNSRTGSFKGRIKNGQWSGTWTNAAGKKAQDVRFTEVRDSLKALDTRVACKVKSRDDAFGTRTTHALDLTIAKGRVTRLSQSLRETGGGGELQRCAISTRDVKQTPAASGILLRAAADQRSGTQHCSIRIYRAGDYLVVRNGDPRQAGDDCRSAGKKSFCSPGAFWLDLVVNPAAQSCRQVK